MWVCSAKRLLVMVILIFFLSACGKNEVLTVDQMEITEDELALFDGNTEQAARMKQIQRWVVEEGLAEPFSYQKMIEELEQVNLERVKENKRGGVVYGIVEYTPLQYYHVIMGEFERLLKDNLMKQADETELRAYYEVNRENYRQTGQVNALLTVWEGDRVTEESQVQIDQYNIRTVSEKDELMVSYLLLLEEGETAEWIDVYGRSCTLVCTKKVADSYDSYEEVKGAVLEQYASEQLELQLAQRMEEHVIQDLRTD